jgi:hypothetical protein
MRQKRQKTTKNSPFCACFSTFGRLITPHFHPFPSTCDPPFFRFENQYAPKPDCGPTEPRSFVGLFAQIRDDLQAYKRT